MFGRGGSTVDNPLLYALTVESPLSAASGRGGVARETGGVRSAGGEWERW